VTAPLLLALVATSAPFPAARGATASLKAPVLVGEAAALNARIGFGIGLRFDVAPELLPLRPFVAFDHDRFSRSVALEASADSPAQPSQAVRRAQRLTTSSFVGGLGWAVGSEPVYLRIGVGAGAQLCFFLYPGAEPLSLSAWKALLRVDAGVGARITAHLLAELGAEWNLVMPKEPDSVALPSGPSERILFDDYPAVVLRFTYTF